MIREIVKKFVIEYYDLSHRKEKRLDALLSSLDYVFPGDILVRYIFLLYALANMLSETC